MRRRLGTILLSVLLGALPLKGQNATIAGLVVEEDTGQVLPQVAVQILALPDSSRIAATLTDLDGRFIFYKHFEGDFVLKFSCLGYQDQIRDLHVNASAHEQNIGKINMPTDAVILQGAKLVEKVEPMTVIEDTVVFNAAAIRVDDDAMVDDLLKKIPGLEINASGTVILHGREVKQILVNGRKYFGGDVKTGLKNLQADMIENIRSYERESDFTRLSGIDDGEKEQVLDLTVKKNALDSWRGTLTGGYGTHNRYNASLNGNKITKTDQNSVMARSHNTPNFISVSNTSRNQIGSGWSADAIISSGGFNVSRTRGKTDFSVNLTYDETDNVAVSRTISENVQLDKTTFSLTNNTSPSARRVLKGDAILEWKPSKRVSTYFKVYFTTTWNSAVSQPLSMTFNEDPALHIESPNDSLSYNSPCAELLPISVNSSVNTTGNFTCNGTYGITGQVVLRSSKKRGRTVTLRLQDESRPVDQNNFNSYNTWYFSSSKAAMRKHYIDVGSTNNVVIGTLAFNEPLTKSLSFQGNLRFEDRVQTQDRRFYKFLDARTDEFTRWEAGTSLLLRDHLASLPEGYTDMFDPALSSEGRYEMWMLNGMADLYYHTNKLNCTAGAIINAKWADLEYSQRGIPGSHDSRITNYSPHLTIRYNPTRTKKLSLTYRSWAGAPAMSNLLPVDIGSAPTSVRTGNPELLPSFSQAVSFSYNYSNPKKQESFVLNGEGRLDNNASCDVAQYEPQTGIKRVTPRNVDGNWRVSENLVWNKTFRDNRFSFSNHLASEYSVRNSFLYNNSEKKSYLNSTGRLMIKEMAELSFRGDWLETIFSAGAEYTDERYTLKPDMHQQPLVLTGGINSTATFPDKTRMMVNFEVMNQRGYSYQELNRNYYILNARLSHPVLKGKATVRLDAYDILGQLDNLTRNFTPVSRNIILYSGVNRFIMLTFTYRFKGRKA